MNTSPKSLKAKVVPEVTASTDWSAAVEVTGLGRSGLLKTLAVRGDATDGTAGPGATIILFEVPDPYPSQTPPDPASIADDDIALRVTGVAVTPHATTAAQVNIADITGDTAAYATTGRRNKLYAAIQDPVGFGTGGKVHLTFRAQGQ